MIQNYFIDITLKRPVETDNHVGGVTTTYTELGTVKGLLERLSPREAYIAQKLGNPEEFVFMTESSAPQTGDIVISGSNSAQLSSSILIGNQRSMAMKTIRQWNARRHTEEA